MAAVQRIGHSTLAECDRRQIQGLSIAKNVADLDLSETPTEIEYRLDYLKEWCRAIPISYRERYAAPVRWAAKRILAELAEQGIKRRGAT